MLLRFHTILIASAMTLAALFALRAFVLFARERAPVDLGMGVGALVVAALLGAYLPTVVAKARARRRSPPR